MNILVVYLVGKRSKKLSKEPLIASVIAMFRGSKRVWQLKSCARLCTSLKVLLLATVAIHCAALVPKLILSLLPAELLRQSWLCKLHRDLGHRGHEVPNLEVQAEASVTWRSLVTTFAVEFKDVSRN